MRGYLPYLIKRYKEAEELKDWHILIGYWSLLVRWQTKNSQDVKPIAEVASHWHSYTHFKCDNPSESHPKPHGFCHGKCEELEEMIQKNLKTRFVEALRFRVQQLPQSTLNFDEKESQEITHAKSGGTIL